LFSACGNPNLLEDIERYGSVVKTIRSHAIANPNRLEKSRLEHEKMLKSIEKGDGKALRSLCVEHLWGALDAYRTYVSLNRGL
jgi:DNA-binding GntR family transcriptional regulator